jgi:hypothetical protein
MKNSGLISEKFIDGDGDTFHVKKTFDAKPTLDAVAQLRSAEVGSIGESKHIGRVPGWMIAEWLKEAGVRWDDIEARDEVVKRKMLSGEVAALRNWTGTY